MPQVTPYTVPFKGHSSFGATPPSVSTANFCDVWPKHTPQLNGMGDQTSAHVPGTPHCPNCCNSHAQGLASCSFPGSFLIRLIDLCKLSRKLGKDVRRVINLQLISSSQALDLIRVRSNHRRRIRVRPSSSRLP